MFDEQHLRDQVERCRRLARSIGDDGVRECLTTLAVEYEQKLEALKTRPAEERSFASRPFASDLKAR